MMEHPCSPIGALSMHRDEIANWAQPQMACLQVKHYQMLGSVNRPHKSTDGMQGPRAEEDPEWLNRAPGCFLIDPSCPASIPKQPGVKGWLGPMGQNNPKHTKNGQMIQVEALS